MRGRDGNTRRRWSDRLIQALTVLSLAATGAAVVFFLALLVNPALPFNPYPPPTVAPVPTPSATAAGSPPTPPPTAAPVPSPTAGPTRSPLPVPTPLRPATLTPRAEPSMPFSATVVYGVEAGLGCRDALIAGSVNDRAGEPLRGYPVHVWGPAVDVIVRSGSAAAGGPGGWEVALPADAPPGSVWSVQMHLDSAYFAYPPLSAIVRVALPADCPQALIRFQERP